MSSRIKPIAALAAAALLSASALAATPSTQFSVTGAVSQPTAYDLAGLAALSPVTQTVGFASGSTTQTHTYTGASLWGTLNISGITTNPAVNNDILNKLVLATGSDGYRAVFSAGELSPNFGNEGNLIAYAETFGGASAPLTAEGFARITAPGDSRGGRYVSNLVNLDVQSSGSTVVGTGGGRSAAFTVSGAVARSQSFDLAALRALPAITRTVGADTYTGVSLWDLLDQAVGLQLDPSVKNDVLGRYLVATATDGYKTVFSLGELSPLFGAEPDFIVYAMNGAELTTTGFARLVVPEDLRRGRWLSNLISLEVFSANAVPEPSSLALALSALGLMGRLARRPGRHR